TFLASGFLGAQVLHGLRGGRNERSPPMDESICALRNFRPPDAPNRRTFDSDWLSLRLPLAPLQQYDPAQENRVRVTVAPSRSLPTATTSVQRTREPPSCTPM